MTLRPRDTDSAYHTPGGTKPGTIAFVGATVLATIGIAVTAVGPWRQGVGYVGGALLLACLVRLLLPERMAGLLRVRRKVVDVTILGVMGFGVVVLALVIPDV